MVPEQLLEVEVDAPFSEKKEAVDQALFVVGAGDVHDRLPRHDQDVHGGLRVDVAEGDAVVVLVDDVGGNLSRDDLFEEGHEDSWARSAS